MRLAIDHTTHYHFTGPVGHGLQRLRLTPAACRSQTVADWSLELEGAQTEVSFDDAHGNHVTLIALDPHAEKVSIRSRGVVDTLDSSGVFGRHTGYLPLWHFVEQTDLTRPGPRLNALLAGFPEADDRLETLHELSALVAATIVYESGHTDSATTAEDAIGTGHGVCQDQAHVFIGAARALGIPARYVSGYLLMNDRVQQEAGHAWAEAHVDGLGWVGFDIANAICPDARYVRLASGRDYKEAAPVTGLRYGAPGESMHVTLAVEAQKVDH
ncbi:transglutaminase family protein [Novosphingobium sp. FKTRR1]|uniref:transglutaminase family protein n=1 Tax=unclassified Novosphingobium TaxID=2644732 RepID=UPI001CF091E6|nr:transglutaminase family protein [Novosphingobium sp. FKTRR1]